MQITSFVTGWTGAIDGASSIAGVVVSVVIELLSDFSIKQAGKESL